MLCYKLWAALTFKMRAVKLTLEAQTDPMVRAVILQILYRMCSKYLLQIKTTIDGINDVIRDPV